MRVFCRVKPMLEEFQDDMVISYP
jgi:kinesin family protein C1